MTEEVVNDRPMLGPFNVDEDDDMFDFDLLEEWYNEEDMFRFWFSDDEIWGRNFPFFFNYPVS